MNQLTACGCVILLGGLLCGRPVAAAPAPPAAPGPDRVRQVETDWLTQADARKGVTTQEDALGAVDGIRNGKWAFHTALESQPWWQVDLGSSQVLDRLVLYNRCDGCAERAANLMVLLSDQGKAWRKVYQHDGSVFYGQPDGKPLVVRLKGAVARLVRIQLPEQSNFLHLDEVEVYGVANPGQNLALWRPCDQSSISPWSVRHVRPNEELAYYPVAEVLARGRKLAADLKEQGVPVAACQEELTAVEARMRDLGEKASPSQRRALYLEARWAVRRLAFRNPLLDFDGLLFVKRQPASYSHMSDQNYGWWSRPGGGVYVLSGLKSEAPTVRCLTDRFAPGTFAGPDLSFDGRSVLFAYCRYYPEVAGLADKEHKQNVPEDAFYHVFEMNVDGSGLHQLTHGRYDDFDPRYLPNGDVLFLSTRRGQFVQCTKASATSTVDATLPDSYVRCGGDPSRPVAVYTLHAMARDGSNLRCLSPFENFEWTPSLNSDGRILYARWDYVDRNNMPYMKLWAMNPDGTNPRMVYGNFTTDFYGVFEARPIPNSTRLVFTASAHHAITGGSLCLLDPARGFDGLEPITRLTPDVNFPEVEGWPETYYANPWPLSERYFLTAWSNKGLLSQGGVNVGNGCGLYLYDAFGNLELIYRDPDISSMYPLPLRPRAMPPALSSSVAWDGRPEGHFILANVYQGLAGLARGSVKRLRLVTVPAKTQPNMNTPNLGVTSDDPGKCVLGTVPVEADGSAYFRAPAGTLLLFQALDGEGRAVQTMRTVTCVQPGQTLSCVGCHEPRNSTPPAARPSAVRRAASRITPGPEGSWPLRFDRLVQPILDRSCVACHRPDSGKPQAPRFDLTAAHAYDSLLAYAQPGLPCLRDHVRARYGEGRSVVNAGAAQTSAVLAHLRTPGGHHGLQLTGDDLDRLVTWMDTYGQRLGSFSDDQERRLAKLREDMAGMLEPR